MSKVNLGLDVIRRRDDGYHEVRMIMQTLKLCDELYIEQTDDGKIRISCNSESLECDENNLIYKAAKLIMDEGKINRGLDIRLVKNIPIAAGMAGGSTDAAATLVALNRMFDLNFDNKKLKEIGVRIGADVPYCIEGGTQLSEGIGEKLTKLKDAPQCFVVVAKPHIGVSTKYVYENLHVDTIKDHPDIDTMLKGIDEGDLLKISSCMENILENVTEKKYPVIAMLKEKLKSMGALNSLMSGSGPTVFALFDDEEKANKACRAVIDTGEVAFGCVTSFSDKTCIIE
ncbi:MAG: 4-(cytidine 5'-diphospho)-2-C-methyl-D-erythritol kinase [Lachnospiraceae bacterium]|nr:4-(cytidine 5'-diphospho)-2-C-methyl-D-erythritol kinase [Lachnospiraceae bacterium]MBP5414260.1 4-(cytidine 5'-diphospho)-2-C-methyl-D-erythritol kinase [Lachnospiraceae bacterium]MBP5746198.1 4-(cytidine 5'-diphospho)-2-C-methyl-D-erythritol kinase [Lachnospiraceae bacterium]